MGTSFTNVQVFTPPEEGKNKREAVIEAVRQWIFSASFEEVGVDEEVEPELQRTVIIGPDRPEPWIGVYDEFSDEFEPKVTDFASYLSKATGFPTVSNLVADSDVTEMGLFRLGERIDYYSSEPGYGEEETLSRAEKAKLKGNPELWQEFLVTEKSPADLRKVWNKRPIFAEDIQRETIKLLGMGEYASFGFRYLEGHFQYSGEPAGFTRLRFRAKRKVSPLATKTEGLPKFQVSGYSNPGDFFTGTPVTINAYFLNSGGPGKGLRVVSWGSAIDQGLVELDKVQITLLESNFESNLNKPRSIQDFALTPFEISEGVKGYELRLPDFELPGGLLPDSETGFLGGINMIRSIKAQFTQNIVINLFGKTLKEGKGQLHFGIEPTANRDRGQTSRTFEISVKTSPKIFDEGLKTNSYLLSVAKALEGANKLYALVTFGQLSKTDTEIIARAIESWHQFTNPPQNSYYELYSQAKVDSKHTVTKLAPDQVSQGKTWQKIMGTLKRGETLAGHQVIPQENQTRHWRIDHNTSGFAFNRNSYPLTEVEKAADIIMAPTLAFWINLDNYAAEEGSQIRQSMVELVDSLAKQTPVLQAFIANWNWPQTPESFSANTLYEAMLGLHGGSINNLQTYNTRFLRAVSDKLWLGQELVTKLGGKQEQVAEIADIQSVRNGLRIMLKESAKLEQLIQVITPIMPNLHDHKAMEKVFYSNL